MASSNEFKINPNIGVVPHRAGKERSHAWDKVPPLTGFQYDALCAAAEEGNVVKPYVEMELTVEFVDSAYFGKVAAVPAREQGKQLVFHYIRRDGSSRLPCRPLIRDIDFADLIMSEAEHCGELCNLDNNYRWMPETGLGDDRDTVFASLTEYLGTKYGHHPDNFRWCLLYGGNGNTGRRVLGHYNAWKECARARARAHQQEGGAAAAAAAAAATTAVPLPLPRSPSTPTRPTLLNPNAGEFTPSSKRTPLNNTGGDKSLSKRTPPSKKADGESFTPSSQRTHSNNAGGKSFTLSSQRTPSIYAGGKTDGKAEDGADDVTGNSPFTDGSDLVRLPPATATSAASRTSFSPGVLSLGGYNHRSQQPTVDSPVRKRPRLSESHVSVQPQFLLENQVKMTDVGPHFRQVNIQKRFLDELFQNASYGTVLGFVSDAFLSSPTVVAYVQQGQPGSAAMLPFVRNFAIFVGKVFESMERDDVLSTEEKDLTKIMFALNVSVESAVDATVDLADDKNRFMERLNLLGLFSKICTHQLSKLHAAAAAAQQQA